MKPRHSTPQFHILVVDDQPVNLRLLEAALSHHGYRVSSAADGQVALALLCGSGGDGGPAVDLVLMDCHMPLMDGFETVRRLRQWEHGGGARAPLPVIAVSAASAADEGQRWRQAGMDGFIAKPFRLPQLLAEIAAKLGRHSAGAVTPAAAGPAAVLDVDGALERLDGDVQLFHTLLAMAARQLHGDCSAMTQALAAGARGEVVRLAHRLRGLLATIGAERSAAICVLLEQQTARLAPLSDADELAALLPLWARLQAELRQLEAEIATCSALPAGPVLST
ncbi:response regulator [Massilia sp. PWRC2]|uniref:response regulator n=1 Tax=Massilia sp. PWRC2 TaxID=2804626 RepID=UPI003CF7A1D3